MILVRVSGRWYEIMLQWPPVWSNNLDSKAIMCGSKVAISDKMNIRTKDNYAISDEMNLHTKAKYAYWAL